MKMDPPMLMMVGVVGLGAFAVWRMNKTKSTDKPFEPAGKEGRPSSIQLIPGKKYLGRLKLETVDVPPLSSSREQLIQFLGVLGFTNLSVYMNPQELPSNWMNFRDGGPDNRWFEGVYSGPVASLLVPRQLDRLA